MATVSRLGPSNHGQPMKLDEFMAGDYEEGYRYELIGGKLYVTPEADAPWAVVEHWVYRKLDRYSDKHSEVINFVHTKARVFVPRRRVTIPEPDIAAYRGFPLHLPIRDIRWQDVSPLLVVEVPTADDPDKDFVRNVALYLQVPTIREYWILDAREDPDRPSLRVYRRRGSRWRIIDVAPGEVYTTPLLPDFELVVDPRR